MNGIKGYISIREASYRWGVSERRVNQYCAEGRIPGASLAMPGIAASIQTGDYSGFETAASIFHGAAALGYIVIGLLAFLLGVCVTVLCFRLRQMNREDDQNKESEGIHGAD